jgi:hypothetical protein
MGRKAHRVSLRQPGCRNVSLKKVLQILLSGQGRIKAIPKENCLPNEKKVPGDDFEQNFNDNS